MQVTVVDYGMGNVGSIVNMLRKIGYKSVVASTPEEILRAETLIIPGVGSFDLGMQRLRENKLEDALNELQSQDPRAHQVVLLRFFAGCTIAQAAHTLGVSESTVESDWRYARAWLHDRLSDQPPATGGAVAS